MKEFILFLGVIFSVNAYSQVHGEHSQTNAKNPSPKPMAAQPIKKEEPRIAVDVPETQQTKIGLKVTKAKKEKINHTIRTVGTVTADQTKEAHVHTKINGWIEQIYADYIGKPVKKGQALFELYSPELVSTQEEYLASKKQGATGREISKVALERLKLWGVPQKEIERLTTSGKSKKSLTFDSPVDGFIVNKTAIRGMYINPEMELYHIADLSRIWIVVTLYEYDISAIGVGDEAELQLPYDPDKSFKGKISYVYPEIDLETRTAKARIEIANPDQKLKPGMFVNVELKKDLGEAIVVPDDSVIDTGTRKLVFVRSSGTKFEPREVKVGPRVGNTFAILSGIKDQEDIVTSAHFLIDAESKFQAALQKGESKPSGHEGMEMKK